MHRFYLPPAQCEGIALTLDEGESHHAADVLRIRKGEQVTVLNGLGVEFLCEARQVHRKAVILTVKERITTPALSCSITLIQSVPKGKLMDMIIQKSTELGATRIIPLLSARVATQLDEAGIEQKNAKWQHVAVEAIKQCGQTWLPKVEAPMTPAELLAREEKWDLGFVGSLQGDGRHPREHFQAFSEQNHRKAASLALWIGPEGDFTPEEMDAIRASGVLPVTLGSLVLRCETAALYALSTARYELSFGEA